MGCFYTWKKLKKQQHWKNDKRGSTMYSVSILYTNHVANFSLKSDDSRKMHAGIANLIMFFTWICYLPPTNT